MPVLERYAWTGFISQAGVALGLAVLIRRTFPDWGGPLQTLVISMIAIHELIGPVLFRWGLDRAGEIEETASRNLLRSLGVKMLAMSER